MFCQNRPKKIVGAVFFWLGVNTIGSLFGQSVMRLVPPIQEAKIQRGRTGTFSVTVINAGDNDSRSRFSAHNLDMTVDGRPFVADSGYARGCGTWIILEPAEVVIKPQESVVIKGTITVPRDAEGGYYALVRGSFTGTTIPVSAEQVDMKDSQIGVESQGMVVVILTVPSSRNRPVVVPETLFVHPKGEKAKTENASAVGFGDKDLWKVVMPVRNDGNIHTRISGHVSFWSESGMHIDSAPLKSGQGYLLPGKIRNLEAKGSKVISDGYYMIRIMLQSTDRFSMSQSFPFAVYEGKVYPGAATPELSKLIRASSPGFALKNPFLTRTITSGGSTFIALQMSNTIRDTLVLVPRKLEWNLDNEGQIRLGAGSGLQSRGCNNWIGWESDRIVLLPGQTESVKIKINTPPDLSGEYYGAITFDPDRPRPDLPAEFLPGRTQLFALSTPRGIEYRMAVDSVTIRRETSPEVTLNRFVFHVTNLGNTHCFAEGSMSFEKEAVQGIYEPAGNAADFGNREIILLPGNRRMFEIDVPDMKSGKYRLILAVRYYQDQKESIVRYQRFTIR